MAMADASQLRQYYYVVSELFLLNGAKTIDIPPHCLTGMEIKHNFEKDIYPVFKVQMVVTTEIYYMIMENKNKIKFKLRIQKYNKSLSSDQKSMLKDFINDTFSLIMDEKEENTERNALDTSQSPASSEAERYTSPIELFFYRDEVATAMKGTINEVLSGSNLTDAISSVCGSAGIKNMLVSPLENQKVYSQLILPPLNIHEELQHLDSHCGFYKSGSMIYFGLKNSYILNYKGGCSAFASGENQQTNFLVLIKNTATSIESGMFEKNDGQYNIHWKSTDIKPSNESISQDVIHGNNVTVVDASTTNIQKMSSTAVTKGSANTTVVRNETENDWVGQTLTAQNNANGLVLTGSVANVDLDALTPNKKFTVIFEDSQLTNQYKGIYFLSQEEIKFVNRGGVDFEVVVGLTLKRVSSKSSEKSESMK